MAVKVTGITGIVKSLDKAITDLVQRVTTETLIDARANTPKRTGQARAAWQRRPGRYQQEVKNTVPYIERLEAGASRQAPRGIIGPTLSQVKGKFK